MLQPEKAAMALGTHAFRVFMSMRIAYWLSPTPVSVTTEMAQQKVDDTGIPAYMMVKVKYQDDTVWRGMVPATLQVGAWAKSVEEGASKFHDHVPVRTIIHGRRQDHGQLIMDYWKPDQLEIKVFLVCALHGGGNKEGMQVMAKNKLATHLLQQGSKLDEVTSFVNKVVHTIGFTRVLQAFDSDNPQKIAVALQEIAKQCGVQVPGVTVKEATQAKVNAAVKRKGLHLQSTLTSSLFTLAEGFFNNEDGSPAQILPVFSTTESGVTLMDYKDSQEWVGSTKLTADELAIVVLGTAHSFQEVVGQKISFPAIDQQGNSVVLNGVLYQLGEKLIKVNTSNRTMIKGTDSVVVSFSMHADEFNAQMWASIVAAPVRYAQNQWAKDGLKDVMLSAPWNRTWKNSKNIAVAPNLSEVVTFFARVPKDNIERLLKTSGENHIYAFPRADPDQPPDWLAVWIPQAARAEVIKMAARSVYFRGLIRSSKAFGVRVCKADFVAAWKEFRPDAPVPDRRHMPFLAKVKPFPHGTTHDDIVGWLNTIKMEARPLKSLGPDTWLIAMVHKPKVDFADYNGNVVLFKVLDKNKPQSAVVLAGTVPQPSGQAQGNDDPWKDWNDPWSDRSGGGSRPRTNTSSTVSRVIDPPIASRFQQYEDQLDALKTSITTIKEDLQASKTTQKQDIATVNGRLDNMDVNLNSGLQTLANTFEQSLATALSNQDRQMRSGFDDLKNLLEATSKIPSPARVRQKTTHEDGMQDDTALWSKFLLLEGSVVLLLWPCSRFLLQRVVVVGSFPFTGLDVQVLGCFCWMVGCRIGEADNPGPHADCQLVDSSVTITIANPSALYGKIDEVRAIDSDVVCFSETSHTESACCFLTKQFRTEGFSSFFSKCVPEKFSTSNGRISLRGEAIGTAIISRLPSRRLRFDMLPVFFDSCRICMCVSRLASREFLFVSVYGFTNTHTAHKKSTMSILLYALQVAGESGLPCIIAGDMNCSVLQQDGWKVFHDSGYVEAHDFVARRLGKTLPPTCRGATSFDTILLPPELQPLLVDAWVNSDHLFDSHDPLTLKFDVSIRNDYTDTWKLPRSWTLFNVPHAIVSDAYDQAMDEAMQDNLFEYRNPDWTFDEAIQLWSHVAEKAVSNAIARHHAIDPQRQPFNSLPPAYKGRGQLVTSSKPICSRPKGLKQEGYDPPCEAFNVKVKHKVKQTRRIQSLCHVLEKHPVVSPDTQRWHDLQLEWLRIKHAPGYGRSWVNWISNFPDIAAVPDLCPSVELLRDFLLLTKFDCDAYSRQLQLNRKNVLKFRIDTDLKEGFGKMTYSWLRKPAPDVITSVQTVWKSEARLVRLSSGKVGLRLCTPTHFVMHTVVKFGDATILPLCLQNDILTFRVVQGVIPTQGTLVQDTFACTGQELAKTFEAYWSPIWNRDAFSEQFTDHPWASIFDMVRDTQHGMTPMDDIDMSADAWYDTAQKLKPGKSVGVDGFHHEDILSLPRRAFEVWSDIIRRFSGEGFSFEMMRAKVVLLSKVADPQHIKDGRPITILGALVRFVTSHFARQIMKHWSFLMPPGLSGGLPGRGVADIVWAQQFELEKAKVSGTPVSGYTLDLSKAFNRLPRRVMRNLMILFGAPAWCVDFWIQSLANLSRTLCWNRQYHGQILSTTGAPEGDAMAVVGMAAISYAFMLALQRRSVTLFAYADNWSWLTPDVRLHVELCHRLVWFTNQCRLVVDFAKSWFWTTHSSHQKFLVAQQQSLPEGVELVFQKFAKDLPLRPG